MNISAPFIQRPIATALLMVGLLAGGLIAYPLLPVASLPSVNYPTLTVTAQLPGADPQTMASTVAAPLELQFGEIPGLTQMTSDSIAAAESKLGDVSPEKVQGVEALLTRAREADRVGDQSACGQALAEVRRVLLLAAGGTDR